VKMIKDRYFEYIHLNAVDNVCIFFQDSALAHSKEPENVIEEKEEKI